MLISGMDSHRKCLGFMMIAALFAGAPLRECAQSAAQNNAQVPPSNIQRPSILDRLNKMAGGKGAWTPSQVETMERLRDAAMKDPYALKELRYLTDNIGPRLSGSPQAQ